MPGTNLVVIQSFGTEAEVNMAKSALESADIDSLVQADNVGGMRHHVAWSGAGYKLLVREDDVDDARSVLEPLPPSSET